MIIKELKNNAQTSDYIFDVIGDKYSEVIRRKVSEQELNEALLDRASEMYVEGMTPEEIVKEFYKRL